MFFFFAFSQILLVFPPSRLLYLLVGINHQYWINHQHYINKTVLLMVNSEYILSYSSGTAALTSLLCWKVSFTNLVLKAKPLLTLSKCSFHLTTSPDCHSHIWQQTPSLQMLSRETPRYYYHPFFFLIINSGGNSSAHHKRMAHTTCAQREFQHKLKKNSIITCFLSLLSRYGQGR